MLACVLAMHAPGSSNSAISELLAKHASWSAEAKGAAAFKTIQELLSRRNSDDFLFVFLVSGGAMRKWLKEVCSRRGMVLARIKVCLRGMHDRFICIWQAAG